MRQPDMKRRRPRLRDFIRMAALGSAIGLVLGLMMGSSVVS